MWKKEKGERGNSHKEVKKLNHRLSLILSFKICIVSISFLFKEKIYCMFVSMAEYATDVRLAKAKISSFNFKHWPLYKRKERREILNRWYKL